MNTRMCIWLRLFALERNVYRTFIHAGFSNVRGHKPVSYVCLELNMAMQM